MSYMSYLLHDVSIFHFTESIDQGNAPAEGSADRTAQETGSADPGAGAGRRSPGVRHSPVRNPGGCHYAALKYKSVSECNEVWRLSLDISPETPASSLSPTLYLSTNSLTHLLTHLLSLAHTAVPKMWPKAQLQHKQSTKRRQWTSAARSSKQIRRSQLPDKISFVLHILAQYKYTNIQIYIYTI